jgi:peptide-methionine (R)-S-oxide reductase
MARPTDGTHSGAMITRRHMIGGIAAGFAMSVPTASFGAYRVTHTDDEWRELLTPDQFAVLRQGATEDAYSSLLVDEHRRGTYACAGCGLNLFSAYAKYESHTGWPSFTAPLRNAIGTKTDKSGHEVRTEMHCMQCGSHIGHLFDDGPPPTHRRYCANGFALFFKPASA